jgi:hypothetical protein
MPSRLVLSGWVANSLACNPGGSYPTFDGFSEIDLVVVVVVRKTVVMHCDSDDEMLLVCYM